MPLNKFFNYCLVGFLLTSCSQTNSVKPESVDKQEKVQTINKRQPNYELTLKGITVGKSHLDDVKKKFKGKNIYHNGDAGKSVYILCFIGADRTTLAFESSGEMGGSNHIITSALIFNSKNLYQFKD